MTAAVLSNGLVAVPRFLATTTDDASRAVVREAALELGWPAERVQEGGVSAAHELLKSSPAPNVLVVDSGASTDLIADLDRLADVCEPHTRVVVLGEVNDVALYRALLGLGVSEYLVKPLARETLVEALRRIERDPAGQPRARTAPTAAVMGSRGGVGATALAVSLAACLASDRQLRTVLFDMDLQFGAAALSLDVEPGRGLREILTAPERIDDLLLTSAMTPHSERLRVLAAEEPLDEEIAISPAAASTVLKSLGATAEAVVVDLPRRTDRTSREMMARADLVVLVTDLSLAGLRDTQRLLTLVSPLRAAEHVAIVANRCGLPGDVPQAEFERNLGRKLDAALPLDVDGARAAAEQAQPLFSGDGRAATLEIRRLAARLVGGEVAATAPAPKPSLVARLLRRS